MPWLALAGWVSLTKKTMASRDSLPGVGWSPRSGSATYMLCDLEQAASPL